MLLSFCCWQCSPSSDFPLFFTWQGVREPSPGLEWVEKVPKRQVMTSHLQQLCLLHSDLRVCCLLGSWPTGFMVEEMGFLGLYRSMDALLLIVEAVLIVYWALVADIFVEVGEGCYFLQISLANFVCSFSFLSNVLPWAPCRALRADVAPDAPLILLLHSL